MRASQLIETVPLTIDSYSSFAAPSKRIRLPLLLIYHAGLFLSFSGQKCCELHLDTDTAPIMKRVKVLSAAGCCAVAICFSSGCASDAQPQAAAHKSSKSPLPADKVPLVVVQALQNRFPAAAAVEWKLKTGNIYEAEFTVNSKEITVMFDAMGKWLETESAIDSSEVPGTVSNAATARFPGYKIVETQSVQRVNRQPLDYELHLDNGKLIAKVQFSGDGRVLSQSSKPKQPK